ncbi:MAG: hypothetical protein HY040_03905 [Planctomycetes bacterium]|nr:hypothetical protein [Planctomycetota bacterium]
MKMNMNNIGKGLVLVYTSATIVALAWAVGVYFQVTDWGWKEPRKEVEMRVASEFDKRVVAVNQANSAHELVFSAAKPAQAALREAENSFGANHLFYNQELKALQIGSGDLDIKGVTFKDGKLELEGKATSKPVLGEKIAGINKSYESYKKELKDLQDKIDMENKDVREWTEKLKDITFDLTGKDDTGKKVKTGLYDLMNAEKEAQDNALSEREYLRPHWARALEEAELFRAREVRMQQRLDELTKDKTK